MWRLGCVCGDWGGLAATVRVVWVLEKELWLEMGGEVEFDSPSPWVRLPQKSMCCDQIAPSVAIGRLPL